MSEKPAAGHTGLVQGVEIEVIFEGKGGNRKQIGVVQKIKIADRIKRKELIGRHTKVQAFKDKIVHETTDPLKELIRQISGKSIRPVED